MPTPSSRRLFGVMVLFLWVTGSHAFDGGGRSEISPYSSSDAITAERVNRQKDMARTSMTAAYELNGAKNTIRAVGVGWTKGGVNGEISHKLKAMMTNGRPTLVDFSEIQELSIVRTKKSSSGLNALIKVILFPNVSAEQLVAERPTYSELKEKYSKTLELWVGIKSNTLGDLCFTGEQVTPQSLENFTINVVVKFEYAGLSKDDRGSGLWKGGGEGIWWAIPSVTRDPKYPYRRPVMAS